MPLTQILDLMGVAVFAISGALVASRKEMDLIGFGLMATLTGIGGGTMRDLILDRPVFWIADQSYLLVCLGAATAAFLFAPSIQKRYTPLLWADAIGLAAFAVNGARISLMEGAGSLTAITLGVMSACFGGLARDVVADEMPLLLRPEIYSTAALAAAAALVLLHSWGFVGWSAILPAIGIGVGLRAGAILRGWSLPRYRSRPGRDW